MVILKVALIAILVAVLFVIGQFVLCARRDATVGKGAIVSTLVSPWFIGMEMLAFFSLVPAIGMCQNLALVAKAMGASAPVLISQGGAFAVDPKNLTTYGLQHPPA